MPSLELNLDALELLRSGVYIVTSAYRNQPAGCTCVWVTRVSFAPPLMAVLLDPGRHTLKTIEHGRRFCINVLGERSVSLARNFGFTSGHDQKKFEYAAYTKSPLGSPVLAEAISWIDCALEGIETVGDHRMVTGSIRESQIVSDEEPLIYNPRTFYQDLEASHSA
jgi:3-hydroxy-9,10-secoandrosta-1,3,5(10)-triene-9,17-dione monooxygenase reductase component